MSEAAPTPKSSSRRWLKIGLGASLTVNLLLIGFIAGHAFHRPSIESRAMWVIHRVTGPLPPPADHAIRIELRLHWPTIKASVEALHRAKAEARAAVHRQPFNGKAVEAAFDAVSARIQVIQKDLHTIVVSAMEKLPPGALGPPPRQ